jgi:putative transposase
MVRYRRNLVPGGTFFFTVTIADRRSSLLVENIAALRHAFRTARNERPFAVDAIVILPEHLHAVMTLPADDTHYSARWRRIKSLFTHHVASHEGPIAPDHRGEYMLWQRRFWEHTIRNEEDFSAHVDYIHYNPIKHGLVSRVRDWPYSSFHRYVRSGLLPLDWGGTVPKQGTGKGFGERKPDRSAP